MATWFDHSHREPLEILKPISANNGLINRTAVLTMIGDVDGELKKHTEKTRLLQPNMVGGCWFC